MIESLFKKLWDAKNNSYAVTIPLFKKLKSQ